MFSSKDLKPIGEFLTEPLYTLYDCGVPCLYDEGNTSVKGEIYNVDLERVMDIHTLELYAGYRFCKIYIKDFPEEVYGYLRPPYPDSPKVESGDWIEYRRRKDEAYLHLEE